MIILILIHAYIYIYMYTHVCSLDYLQVDIGRPDLPTDRSS